MSFALAPKTCRSAVLLAFPFGLVSTVTTSALRSPVKQSSLEGEDAFSPLQSPRGSDASGGLWWNSSSRNLDNFVDVMMAPAAKVVLNPSHLSGTGREQDLPDQSWSSVTLSLAISGVQLLAALSIFEGLLLWRPGFRFLAPRLAQRRGPEAGVPWKAPFGWVQAVWHERGRHGSLEPDGLVLVRFCELGLKFCLCGTALDTLLLPMYATGHGSADGFNRLSLSNLKHGGSFRFWGVIVAAYTLTAAFARFAIEEWHSFVACRREHYRRLASGIGGVQAAQAQRSLMVENIPAEQRSPQAIGEFFGNLFGDSAVHSCVLQTNTAAAYHIQGLYRTSRRLSFCCCCPSRAHSDLHELGAHSPRSSMSGQPEPPRSPGLFANSPPDREDTTSSAVPVSAVGLIEFVQDPRARLRQAAQDLARDRPPSSTAFVTLRSAAHCVTAKQVVLTHAPGWDVVDAPETRDLIWRNVSIPLNQLKSRNRAAVAACSVGLVFWTVPVGLIQTWSSIANVEQWLPLVTDLREWSPVIFSFLTAWMPVLALMALQALLPRLFEASAVAFEGHKAKSRVQRIVLNRCFAYQLASLYVMNMSGSIIRALQDIFDSPKNVLNILASSLPQVAVYFFSLVMARVSISLPLLLLRPWDVPATGASARAAESRPAPVRCYLGSQAADSALVLVIGLTYSFIAPAILPACALYFGLASIVYRWLFANVYEPEFDGGGVIWYDLFNSVLLGLLLGALSLLGLAAAYASYGQFMVLLPLPFVVGTLGWYCWYRIGFQSKHVSLGDAVQVDAAEDPTPGFTRDFYEDPILSWASFETALEREVSG